ncbi:uncharacterized protein LY89DRAFT_195714 [Mollisia scopiformis]|uniref:Uncharacterized protein n=1 Tax=Mollisia scopiformis TaxID=149040 RepID=A0A194WYV3_MOLSC|nr:uncharacterized protein LY89DRAFT_195714 [Mollisia scopiformis]KUJ12874.1 hypothetical protein LY89DRAFT_195714 [Mollisia scopiformis]
MGLMHGLVDPWMVLLLSYTNQVVSLAPGLGLQSIQSPRHPAPSQPRMESVITGLTCLTKVDFSTIHVDDVSADSQSLRSLYHFHSPNSYTVHSWNSIELATLFALPRVSWARIHVWERTMLGSFDFSKYEALKLKTLHLIVCFVHARFIGPLFEKTPDLESLHINLLLDPSDNCRLARRINCVELTASLSKLTNRPLQVPLSATVQLYSNLRNLTIVTKVQTSASATHHAFTLNESRNGLVDWGVEASVVSLEFLDRLEFLEIEMACLFGWDRSGARPICEIVPDSLKVLKLTSALGALSLPVSFSGFYQWDKEGLLNYFRFYPDSHKRCNIEEIILHEKLQCPLDSLQRDQIHTVRLSSLLNSSGVALRIQSL